LNRQQKKAEIPLKLHRILFKQPEPPLYLGEKNLHGRTVFYSTTADLALNKWLATRDTTSEYLFYGYGGKQLCYVTAWMIMKDALQKAGLEGKGYSLHSLRHTFATNMLNAGLRLEVLQQLLGHLTIDIPFSMCPDAAPLPDIGIGSKSCPNRIHFDESRAAIKVTRKG
jgi:site-specific recombinase XerD